MRWYSYLKIYVILPYTISPYVSHNEGKVLFPFTNLILIKQKLEPTIKTSIGDIRIEKEKKEIL